MSAAPKLAISPRPMAAGRSLFADGRVRRVLVGGPVADPSSLPDGGEVQATLPTVVTLAGYAASIAWLMGGPTWLGIAGVLADEVDGRLARATGQTSKYGASLDLAVDWTLTGATAYQANLLWALPAVTAYQAYRHSTGDKPTVGSARAAITLWTMLRRNFSRLPGPFNPHTPKKG